MTDEPEIVGWVGGRVSLRMRTPADPLGSSERETMAELGEVDEAELQRLVAAEQQKAQFTAQVRDPGGLGPKGK